MFGADLREVVAEADTVLLNLECCISERGSPAPGRVFHFRAPPVAVEALALLGVDCVTLANNHAADYGDDALRDTLRLLVDAGITPVGAGEDVAAARAAAVLRAGRSAVAVVAVADHYAEYGATGARPGTAYADLVHGVPPWLREEVGVLSATGAPVLVTPHWGPNMTSRPVPHVRAAAAALTAAGATLVAGHSAHVFHGVRRGVLFDLGDLVDDYAVDPQLRNDLGLLWLVTLEGQRLARVEAVPTQISGCRTTLAGPAEAAFVEDRLRELCQAEGGAVERADGRLVVHAGAA